MKILAMDMGGTFIKWAVMELKNGMFHIVERDKFRTFDGDPHKGGDGGEVVRKMAHHANTLHMKYKDLQAVATTAVGVIDMDNTVVLSPNHTFKNYQFLNLQKEFDKVCRLPFYVMNDVKAAALCETTFGSIKNKPKCNAIFIAIGTGIAACPIIDGKIYYGSSWASGECGQLVIEGHFFENHYSGQGLINQCREVDPSIVTAEECLTRAKTEQAIKIIVDRWFLGVAEACMIYVYILNPEYIIFSGGLTEHEYFDLTTLKKIMLQYARKPVESFEYVKLVKATYGNDSPLYGVASLALKHK